MDTTETIAPDKLTWTLPVIWCAATAAIILTGLAVPLQGGPGEAGFGYVFEVAGYGHTLRQGLAVYSAAAAGLGLAFMFIPKMHGWRINRALAWATFVLMMIGGMLMLVVPQALVALAEGSEAEALARAWSGTWLDAGSRISLSAMMVGVATLGDAWMRRPGR